MAHLISPLNLGGDIRKVDLNADPSASVADNGTPDNFQCSGVAGVTPFVLSGDASDDGGGIFTVYHSAATSSPPDPDPNGPISSGSIIFGVACATEITIDLTGVLETLNDFFEWIEVWHNGDMVDSYSSESDGLNDPFGTETVTPTTVIDVSVANPCSGHIIQIIGSTGDAIANNGVGWTIDVIPT